MREWQALSRGPGPGYAGIPDVGPHVGLLRVGTPTWVGWLHMETRFNKVINIVDDVSIVFMTIWHARKLV